MALGKSWIHGSLREDHTPMARTWCLAVVCMQFEGATPSDGICCPIKEVYFAKKSRMQILVSSRPGRELMDTLHGIKASRFRSHSINASTTQRLHSQYLSARDIIILRVCIRRELAGLRWLMLTLTSSCT